MRRLLPLLFLFFVLPLAAEQLIPLPPVTLRDIAMPVADELPVVAPPVASDATATLATGFKSTASSRYYPADASGAVSPSFVVGVSNADVTVQDRTGRLLIRTPLYQFMSVETDEAYDPRIVYDARARRWVVTAVYEARGIRVAISQTDDPTGAWNRYFVSLPDVDYSNLVVTRDYVIASTYDFQGSLLLYLRRETIYNAAPGAQIGIDGVRTNFNEATPVATDASTASAYYITAELGGLALYERGPGTASKSIAAFRSPVEFAAPVNGPQLTGDPLDVGLPDFANAVIRNGTLYAVQSASLKDASNSSSTHSAIIWWKYRLGDEGAGVSVIRAVNTGLWLTYPSIAVNSYGGVFITFSILSGSMYPSSGYVYIDATTSTPIVTIKSGESSFPHDRWGDYNTAVVDPMNDRDFWSVTTYADSGNRWATWWANVQIPPSRRRAVR